MGKLINLTVEERILIHLYDYIKYHDAWEVPIESTQEGIATAINIELTNVPRSIKKLKSRNFVVERSAHVKGVPRMRKAYFLTPNGILFVNKLISALNERSFPVKVGSELKSVRFNELQGFLKSRVSYSKLIEYISNLDLIDVEKLKSDLSEGLKLLPGKEKPKYTHMELAPVVKEFFNRDKEIELLHKVSGASRLIIITGKRGIGKTTLISKYIERYLGEKHVFWASVDAYKNENDLIYELATFLSKIERGAFLSLLKSKKSPNLTELCIAIKESFNKTDTIFVLDNYEKADDELKKITSIIANIIPVLENTVLIIISEEDVKFQTTELVAMRNHFRLKLEPFDEISANEWFKAKGLTPDKWKYAYFITEGIPLAIENLDLIKFKELKEKMKTDELLMLRLNLKMKLGLN